MTTYSPKKHQNGSYPPQTTSTPVQPSPPLGPWSTGLFDCCDDYHSCCLTLWCPCVSVGRVSEIADQGVISCRLSGTLFTLLVCVCGCSCCYTAWIRCKLRARYSLENEPCNDCLLHCCCELCAVCQEYRELVNRGYDMSLGWEGNVERHKRMTAMMQPVTVQWGMVR